MMDIDQESLSFEDSLREDLEGDMEMMEVPLGERPIFIAGILAVLVVFVMVGRIIELGGMDADRYAARAQVNIEETRLEPSPRGEIFDRFGRILAQNKVSFSVTVDLRRFSEESGAEQEETLETLRDVLGISSADLRAVVGEAGRKGFVDLVTIAENVPQSQVVQVESYGFPAVRVRKEFLRVYPDSRVFSSVVGYVGFPTLKELTADDSLSDRERVGRAGVEAYYNTQLKGKPGISRSIRDATGKVIGTEKKQEPEAGTPLSLTIDGGLQEYLVGRLSAGLVSLGRTSGVGLVMDPYSGEILALVNFPLYDNEVLSGPGKTDEKRQILSSSLNPLFDRTVAGAYAPGSTIKPLVGVAVLHEGVAETSDTVFSPGFLDVPNPYDPGHPSRFLDWRYQGEVDLYSAIAQSSNVYFYIMGGGTEGKGGLGIGRLREWWERFGLGSLTGIDLPGETSGFLPSPEWKERERNDPWRLGDTYNVSIGQGDLLVSPIQLLRYISVIANGGDLIRPKVNMTIPDMTVRDLSYLSPEVGEIAKGMRQAVTSPLGTAHLLSDLPFSVAAKTGSAQVANNARENAFFVGYAPVDKPEIAVLILVEDSREGSLNAVPIAKDVLNWYYWNRIASVR